MARYNIAPGQIVPVIIANNSRRSVPMRWGLIPHWAKDEKMAYKMINGVPAHVLPPTPPKPVWLTALYPVGPA